MTQAAFASIAGASGAAPAAAAVAAADGTSGDSTAGLRIGTKPVAGTVRDLGIVGRGQKRIALAPVAAAPAGGAAASAAPGPAAADQPKRRRLDDLMGARLCCLDRPRKGFHSIAEAMVAYSCLGEVRLWPVNGRCAGASPDSRNDTHKPAVRSKIAERPAMNICRRRRELGLWRPCCCRPAAAASSRRSQASSGGGNGRPRYCCSSSGGCKWRLCYCCPISGGGGAAQ